MNRLKRLVFVGQYSVFAVPGLESAVLSQKNQSFQGKKCKNAVLSEKNQKNQSLETLGSFRAWRSPNFGYFWFFWDSTAFLLVLAYKDWFFWRFLQSQASKVLYCPKKTNRFKAKSAKRLYCPKKTKKSKVWRPWAPPVPGGLQTLVFGFFWDSTAFLLVLAYKDCFFWDSTAFLQSQASKVLYCPKKTNLFKAKSAKMLYCPKKTKKPKFGDLGLLQGLEVSKLWFFWFFLGQYGIFACFCLKDWFFWDSTAFLQSQASKVLYCPKKRQSFQGKKCKNAVLSQKNQKNQSLETLGSSRAWRSPNFGFFGFFGPVRHFCLFLLKRLVFLGQYSVFAVPGLESAVLSQKNQSF